MNAIFQQAGPPSEGPFNWSDRGVGGGVGGEEASGTTNRSNEGRRRVMKRGCFGDSISPLGPTKVRRYIQVFVGRAPFACCWRTVDGMDS